MKFFIRTIRAVLNLVPLLLPFEARLINKTRPVNHRAIFILGLPRSGTTLMYQMLTHSFRTCYFSNFCTLFYKSPVTISKLTRSRVVNYKHSCFNSSYGYIKGAWAPSESGAIMRNWFRVVPKEKNISKAKKSCNSLMGIFEAPLVSKNIYHAFFLEEIALAFQDVMFVYIERELFYNIQSIIIGLRDRKFSPEAIGIKSAEYSLAKNKTELIARKTTELMNETRSFFKCNGNLSVVKTYYKELCADPMQVINQIEEEYNRGTKEIERKSITIAPLEESMEVKLSDEDSQIVKEVILKYENIN